VFLDDRRHLEKVSQLLEATPIFILGEFVTGISCNIFTICISNSD